MIKKITPEIEKFVNDKDDDGFTLETKYVDVDGRVYELWRNLKTGQHKTTEIIP